MSREHFFSDPRLCNLHACEVCVCVRVCVLSTSSPYTGLVHNSHPRFSCKTIHFHRNCPGLGSRQIVTCLCTISFCDFCLLIDFQKEMLAMLASYSTFHPLCLCLWGTKETQEGRLPLGHCACSVNCEFREMRKCFSELTCWNQRKQGESQPCGTAQRV